METRDFLCCGFTHVRTPQWEACGFSRGGDDARQLPSLGVHTMFLGLPLCHFKCDSGEMLPAGVEFQGQCCLESNSATLRPRFSALASATNRYITGTTQDVQQAKKKSPFPGQWTRTQSEVATVSEQLGLYVGWTADISHLPLSSTMFPSSSSCHPAATLENRASHPYGASSPARSTTNRGFFDGHNKAYGSRDAARLIQNRCPSSQASLLPWSCQHANHHPTLHASSVPDSGSRPRTTRRA